MKSWLAALGISLACVACDEKADRVVVEETRRVTSKDKAPKLFATSDERFRDAKPSPVKGEVPEGWLELPATEMRLKNFRFGESGLGEVWVSITGGSVADNVNRWLKQFGKDPLNPEQITDLEKVTLADTEGVWVAADGEYGAGMGADAKPGYGLAGIIAVVEGKILTVKMVGPAREVEKAKDVLRQYAKSLQMIN
ncbi:MAG: hypothetical protein H7Y36_05565 [Armatimonadetes bacterium]|nr:hypothetical protein [Akkermansiaceae bacterium]